MSEAGPRMFDRVALLAALERIGVAAVAAGALLDLFVYGGSALMLASNFRYATEDVDIATVAEPWPHWLSDVVARIGSENGWDGGWLNEAVQFHLSSLADRASDHVAFANFPRGVGDGAGGGLRVSVPSAAYMLALKLKALRINDPGKGPTETEDVRQLLRVNAVRSIDDAIEILRRFFPRSAQDPDRRRFFLKHIWPTEQTEDDPPRYPVAGR